MNTNLSHVSVSAVLVVADDCDLDHEGPNWIFADVFDGNYDPAGWFTEINDFDFVEVVEMCAATNGDS